MLLRFQLVATTSIQSLKWQWLYLRFTYLSASVGDTLYHHLNLRRLAEKTGKGIIDRQQMNAPNFQHIDLSEPEKDYLINFKDGPR